MMDFNKEWIKAGYATTWFNDHKVVKADHFKRFSLTGEECEGKVILGRLLAVTTPDKSGKYGGMNLVTKERVSTAMSSNKTRRLNCAMYAGYSYILMFADQYNLPDCFAIILKHKRDLQTIFGAPALSDNIRIGDIFVIVEPRPTAADLGKTINVIRDPNVLAKLDDQAYAWNQIDLRQSDAENTQVAFYKTALTINVSMIRLKWGREVKCSNRLCDRQNVNCQGCHGASTTLRPIVLECDVSVLKQSQYDVETGKASFDAFRSLRFSEIFFSDISQLSNKPSDVLQKIQVEIGTNTKQMVKHINKHGGWTLCGWHRRGMLREEEGEESAVLALNKGHIVLLYPTKEECLNDAEFKKLLIQTPELASEVTEVDPEASKK